MQELNALFYVIVLIMSVVVHEVSHGFAAYYLGDNTARDAGRLTLNPLKHLDLFGSVVLPILLILSQTGIIFGWAKPVPYNPHNLRNVKKGTIIVASAGIIANLTIAIVFGLFIRFAPVMHIASPALYAILSTIVLVNLVLAIFNLIPLPPLDGSRILFALLPARARKVELFLETYAFIFLLVFILLLWQYVAPLLFSLFHLLTGLSF